MAGMIFPGRKVPHCFPTYIEPFPRSSRNQLPTIKMATKEDLDVSVEHVNVKTGFSSDDALSTEWTEADETRIKRKMDWRLVPTVALLYLMCFIDRANIG